MNMNYAKQKCKFNFILITYETMNMNMNMKQIRLWCKFIVHIGVEQFGGNK